MSLDCHRIASSTLLWINLVGASSIAISLMVGISSQPAQANQPESVTPGTEPLNASLSITNSQELAQQQPLKTPSITSTVAVIETATAFEPVSEVREPVKESNVEKDKQRSQFTSPNPCDGTTCSIVAQLPSLPQTITPVPVPAAPIPGGNNSNSRLGQLPYLPQPPSAVPTPPPVGNNYSPMGGQAYYPQMMMLVPVPATGMMQPPTGYPQMVQPGYSPQMMMVIPMPATGMMQPPTGYPQMVQPGYSPQMMMLVPMPATGMMQPPTGYPQMGQSVYNPQMVQPVPNQMGQPYYPQMQVAPLPAPLAPSPGFNNYPQPQQLGQPYYQQVPVAPGFNNYQQPQQFVPVAPGFNNYQQPQQLGQQPYYQQVPVAPNFNNYQQPQQLVPVAPNFNNYQQPQQLVPVAPSFNNYQQPQQLGQSPYYQQAPVAPNFNNYQQPQQLGQPYYQPVPVAPSFNNYQQPQQLGQQPYYQQVPVAPNFNNYQQPQQLVPVAPPTTAPLQNQQPPLLRSTALTAPSLQLQGTYINQGDQSSARARLSTLYPLTPQVQFGASLDLTSEANSFADSRGQGLNVNELYVAAAPFTGLPNLRFVVGQLDLTSYFDRNSFAKDGATQFFNPVFQTNPALSATGIASRPGALVNWTLTDNIEAKAAIFSSSRSLGDFSLDAFAGEIGFRYGNAIIRGTYSSDRDAGSRDGFREIFGVIRDDGTTGIRSSDREDSYGVNAEYFVPNLNMGLFARYGRYENQTIKRGGDTYSLGVSFADVISKDDRLGLAYGRNLSNDLLRRQDRSDVPDVLELFYDFRFLPNLRLGFTIQQRNGFDDTYAGFRVKTDFDLTPRGITP
ncbi:MAG: hypothetical protein WBG73_14090 [Coleofasciculaceae cyanobacterium]